MTDQLLEAAHAVGHAPRGLPEGGLKLLRPFGRRYIERRWKLRERGTHHVPEQGPVIIAANHIGWMDGPLLITCTPRPAHALVKSEAFEGKTGRLLRFVGQIEIEREEPDVGALRAASDALAAGQAVVVYPEGKRGDGELHEIKNGVAWLALVTGAPVVPVAIFGTRAPGADSESRPAPGATLDLMYGAPLRFDLQPWPRTSSTIADVGDQIHHHLRDHLVWAQRVGQLSLPGPLPEGTTVV